VWLVESGGVQDGLDAVHAAGHEVAVGDGTHVGGVRRWLDVETDRLVIGWLEGAHQCLAEMARAAGHQDLHEAGF
jgi:hypothetical protein